MDYHGNKKEAIETLKTVLKWLEKPGKHNDYDVRDFNAILDRVKIQYDAYLKQGKIQRGVDDVYTQNYLEL